MILAKRFIVTFFITLNIVTVSTSLESARQLSCRDAIMIRATEEVLTYLMSYGNKELLTDQYGNRLCRRRCTIPAHDQKYHAGMKFIVEHIGCIKNPPGFALSMYWNSSAQLSFTFDVHEVSGEENPNSFNLREYLYNAYRDLLEQQ